MGIAVGIGGWTYAAWEGSFFPQGLPAGERLRFASRALRTIEINTTFYVLQRPAVFARWAAATPEGFRFSVKGPRSVVEAPGDERASALDAFWSSGVAELGDRLGAILWQLPRHARFDDGALSRFLDLLPRALGGVRLRHVIEPRHASFLDERFVALARERDVAICCSDDAPTIADVAGDLVYVRLHGGRDDEPECYPADELDAWASRLRTWAEGGVPAELPLLAEPAPIAPREVLAYVVRGGKRHAPAGAAALQRRVG